MADDKYPHGTVCWNELITRDMARAEKFYTELLGWKAVDSGMPGMKYTMFQAGDKHAGGMMTMPADAPDDLPSHWLTYISVDGIDALAEKVKELGGTVLHGPMDVPTVGRFCIIQDPTGGVISLITMTE